MTATTIIRTLMARAACLVLSALAVMAGAVLMSEAQDHQTVGFTNIALLVVGLVTLAGGIAGLAIGLNSLDKYLDERNRSGGGKGWPGEQGSI